MTDPTDVTEPTTPVPPAPPAPSDHSRTARTVAAVVAVVALAGGVGALFGGGRSNEEPTRRTPTGALTTPPAAVEAPEEVELPGPKAPGITGSGPGKSVRPLVQAGPDMTIEPPTDLGDETTTTTEADSTSDDPGTSSDEPGTSDDAGTSDASGDVVAIPGDLSVTLAEGWGDASTGDGYTVVTTAGAALAIGAYDVTDQVTAADLLAEETRAQGDSVSDLHLTDIEDIPVNTVHVSGGAGRIYEGILVSQNGSVAVEGDLYAIVLDDGTGYTFTTTTQKGGYDEHGADFQAMISSVLASIGARP